MIRWAFVPAVMAVASGAAAAETVTYTYDSNGRLVKATHDAASTKNPNIKTQYCQDKADNRKRVTTGTSAPPAC